MNSASKTQAQILKVEKADEGQKLTQFLRRKLGPQLPGAALMRWIRTGQVRIDGGRVKPFDRVRAGQGVRVPPYVPPAESESGLSGNLRLPIIFEDEEILVLNKPAGLPTQPGSGWIDAVSARLNVLYKDQGFVPVPAHRLDRDTSGVLVAAKTHPKLRELHEAFRERSPQKEYLAWVKGELGLGPGEDWLTLEDELEKKGAPGAQRVRTGEGKKALSYAKPLLVRDGSTLLLLKLVTGLTHQLRVQLASRGHPIIGDPKYGAGTPPMLLHAYRLRLGEMCFVAKPPWKGEWEVEDLE